MLAFPTKKDIKRLQKPQKGEGFFLVVGNQAGLSLGVQEMKTSACFAYGDFFFFFKGPILGVYICSRLLKQIQVVCV